MTAEGACLTTSFDKSYVREFGRYTQTVLLHYGGFCTPNGACTYQCISNEMHYKRPFSHNGYMKSLELYENYITLFCLE
jgi:hypothetical protein